MQDDASACDAIFVCFLHAGMTCHATPPYFLFDDIGRCAVLRVEARKLPRAASSMIKDARSPRHMIIFCLRGPLSPRGRDWGAAMTADAATPCGHEASAFLFKCRFATAVAAVPSRLFPPAPRRPCTPCARRHHRRRHDACLHR